MIASSIPFLMLPVLTRHLTPQEYGLVSAFLLVTSFIGALTGLSVHGAVGIRYFERDKYDLPRYVAACLLILMTTTAVVLAAVGLLGPWLEQALGIARHWLLLAVLVSGAQFVIQVQLALWQSSGKPLQFGLLRIFQSAIDASTSLALVVGIGMAWQGRVVGIAVATLAAAALACATLSRNGGLRWAGSREYVPDALRYGVPLVAHVLGGLLITTGDKLVVGGMLSLHELGYYTVATQVAMVLNVAFDSLFKAFHPWVIENALIPERRGQVVRTIYKVLACAVLFGALFCGVAYAGYAVFVSERYAEGRYLLLPLVLASIIRCGYFATAIFINVAGRNAHLATNTLISGLVGVAAAALMTPRLGVLGAAMGVLISECLSFALNLRSSVKVYPMPWTAPWRLR